MKPDDAERILLSTIINSDEDLIWTNKDKKKLLPERGITINLILSLSQKYEPSFFKSVEHLKFNGEYDKILDNNKIVYPDIIFHGGQTNTNNQIFACEVKKFPEVKSPSKNYLLFYDFYKLVNYLYLERKKRNVGMVAANYERVYMILVNCTKDDLLNLLENFTLSQRQENKEKEEKGLKMIKKYLSDERKSNRFKFILVSKDYKNHLETLTLDEIYNESNNFKNLINRIEF